MIAFTILGLIVFYVWCFQAGYWLGFALDVLLPMWLSVQAFDVHLMEVLSAITRPEPSRSEP